MSSSFEEKYREMRKDFQDRTSLLWMSFHTSDAHKIKLLDRINKQHTEDLNNLRAKYGMRKLSQANEENSDD